jgi:transcriptional regulator with GAF, ATPase, and Fis domain
MDACHQALTGAEDNLSAAARALGLTRAQLDYRLQAGSGSARTCWTT